LGLVIKVAITSTKLPSSKGYHIKIYPVDTGDYKKTSLGFATYFASDFGGSGPCTTSWRRV